MTFLKLNWNPPGANELTSRAIVLSYNEFLLSTTHEQIWIECD